jgi:serine/threonine-protein kinase
MLSSRYKVLRKLGAGGMGVVYAARDTEIDLDVAVKVLPTVLSGSELAMKQIRREAKVAMSLTHENIVRVHNLEVEPSGAFLVMELVEGRTLAEELEKRGTLPEDEVVNLAQAMCRALGYAHGKGVLHRDLKPANVMVTGEGLVKLMDFGIARVLRDTYTRVSGESSTSGTLLYMSPEQLLDRPTDARSDIYSLCVMLYELLSGEPPFARGDITYRHLHEEPRAIEGVSQHVNAAVLKGLGKDPGDRWRDAGTLADALSDSLAQRWRVGRAECPSAWCQIMRLAACLTWRGSRPLGTRALRESVGARPR